jgi:mono/diheme cytochrome c family protein
MNTSFRNAGKLVAIISLLFLAPSAGANNQPDLAGPPSNQPLVWDAYQKSAKMSGMNQTTNFIFWVTNVSNADVSILSTESSCDCTVAKLPAQPWVLKPGESGSLGVKMNLMGRHGQVSKVIQVTASCGNQFLMVSADIPLTPAPFNVSARQRDQMMAQKDRQAVFRGSCAACHALPAAGHMGETLFTKACAICHISDHRAAMVPDLAALAHPTDAGYWGRWIALGKEGTLMPAFAASAGGILNTNQIESLVEYLVKAYPRKLSGAGVTNTSSVKAGPP